MAKKSTTKSRPKVEKVMHEFKEGSLKSGSGKKVTSRKQAIAVALSEARKSGARIPKKKAKSKSWGRVALIPAFKFEGSDLEAP